MPIFPIDPAAQAAVSGTNLPRPGVGPGLDQFAASQREEQGGQRALVDAIGRQTPGFLAYLTANHPDIVSELSGTPRMFRGADEQPLPQRLQGAMQAFMSQPPPAEEPLKPEESVALNEHVESLLNADPRLRGANPNLRGQIGLLTRHMISATDPHDQAATRARIEQLLGARLSPPMQDASDAAETLNSGVLGYLTPDEKAAMAASYALKRTVPTQLGEKDLTLENLIKERQLVNADLDTALKRQELANKKIIAERGEKIPQKEIEFLGNIASVLHGTNRAVDALKDIGPLGTTMGYLLHEPAYQPKAAEINAVLSTLSVTFERLGLQLPGRVSPQLIDMLKGALVDYSKTPTQLHGILANAIDTLTDLYDSRLDEMERAGIAKPDYYDEERKMIQPFKDLADRMHLDKKWTPIPASFMQRTKAFLGVGPGAEPDATSTESPTLFPLPAGEEQ